MLRRTPLKRGKPPKAKKRTASEFSRIYGSKARVRWVKGSPCVSCDSVTGRNHNHHIRSGGMGRKSDAETIVSLCPPCHDELHRGLLGRTTEWWDEQARQTDANWLQIADTFEGWDAESE